MDAATAARHDARMSPLAKRLVSTLVGSLLTGLYWFAFFFVAYGITAGDPAPGTPASGIGLTITVHLAGLLLYAAFAWGWRSLDFAWLGRPR